GSAFFINRNYPEVSPGGRLLVLSGDGELYLWDLRTGRQLARRPGVAGPVAFSPDGKSLACASNRAIYWMDLDTLKIARVSRQETRIANAVAFSPDGRRLAVGGEHSIRLWDVATGKPLPHP